MVNLLYITIDIKKYKKQLYNKFIIKKICLLAIIILSSCSTDQEEHLDITPENFFGDWQWVALTSTIAIDYNNDGEASKDLYKQWVEICMKDDIIRFEKGSETSGPYFELENEQTCNSNEPYSIKKSTSWTLKNQNEITIMQDDHGFGYRLTELTSRYLTLERTIGFEDGIPKIYSYRYKKL